MAKITQPGEGRTSPEGRIDSTGPTFNLRGAQSIAQKEKQLGREIENLGKGYFQAAQKSLRDSSYNDAISEATLELNKRYKERLSQTFDKNGNPTFATLDEDIQQIGKDIRDDLALKLIDPAVGSKFDLSFNNMLTNKRLQGQGQARKQHMQFSRASIQKALDSFEATSKSDESENMNLYVNEIENTLEDAVEGGVLGKDEAEKLKQESIERVRINKYKEFIKQDPRSAEAEITKGNLGVSKKEAKKLKKEAKAALKKEKKLQDKRIKDTIKSAEQALKKGDPLTEVDLDNISALPISDTKKTELLNKNDIVETINDLSIEDIESYETETNKEFAEKIKANVLTRIEKDPVEYTIKTEELEVAPLDPSQNLDSQLTARKDIIDATAVKTGKSSSGLTESEVSSLMDQYSTGGANTKMRMIRDITSALGDDSIDLLQRFQEKGRSDVAFLGSLALEGNTYATRLAIQGDNIIKEKQNVKLTPGFLNPIVAENIPSYALPEQKADVMKTVNSVVQKLMFDRGVLEGSISFERDAEQAYIDAMNLVTNGVLEYNDTRIEAPKAKMTQREFDGWIDGLTAEDIDKSGGVGGLESETFLEELRSEAYQIKMAGRGMYYLADDQNEIVIDKQGFPFILNYSFIEE